MLRGRVTVRLGAGWRRGRVWRSAALVTVARPLARESSAPRRRYRRADLDAGSAAAARARAASVRSRPPRQSASRRAGRRQIATIVGDRLVENGPSVQLARRPRGLSGPARACSRLPVRASRTRVYADAVDAAGRSWSTQARRSSTARRAASRRARRAQRATDVPGRATAGRSGLRLRRCARDGSRRGGVHVWHAGVRPPGNAGAHIRDDSPERRIDPTEAGLRLRTSPSCA